MKRFILQVLLVLAACAAFGELNELPRNLERLNEKGAQVDLGRIKERGFIRVLTRNNPACYFMHRGELMGFEYELVHRFARKHGLKVVMIVPENWDDMYRWLEEGRGDLIAAAVTITSGRWHNERGLKFCHHYGKVFEEIIARADDHSIHSWEDLAGHTIHVRASSSYHETLENLREQKNLDFTIQPVSESEETFEILNKVASGEYDLTCADSSFLDQSVRLGERVRPVLRLEQPRTYGWMVRSNQPELRQAIHDFFAAEINSSHFETLYKRYFELAGNQRLKEHFVPAESGQISPFDNLIKKHAGTYGFPWTLVCSQIFQESSFRPDAVSWSGAQGLMQLMPATARELGIEDPFDPDENIRAGTRYLKKQYSRVPDEVDAFNTTCFALASYNGGYGHLIDARKLADKLGKNPNIWIENVDHAYALLSEPHYAAQAKYGYCRSGEIIDYVQKIMSRYVDYETAMGRSPLQ
jgi:membrane-bound lytic murein transglycosylase F